MLSPTGQYETAPALIEHLSQPALMLIASIFASTSCLAMDAWAPNHDRQPATKARAPGLSAPWTIVVQVHNGC